MFISIFERIKDRRGREKARKVTGCPLAMVAARKFREEP
jgi:hypothetical protein